ncbi:cytochrome c [bacterium]|nr:cytochrome c [bacterium]
MWGVLFFSISVFAQSPDWSQEAVLPIDGRSNPYNFSESELQKNRKLGQIHAHLYPVESTGILVPERPLRKILDNTMWNPFKAILNEIFKDIVDVDSFEGLFVWAGLVPPPDKNSPEMFQVALPDNIQKDDLYGYSRIKKEGVDAFTMSCAACHSDQLFGQTILGMSKRFPRANEFFLRAQSAAKFYDPLLVQLYTGANETEIDLLDTAMENLKSVGLKQPLVLGLDTSLAQVALSLNRRAPTTWAEVSRKYQQNPRPDLLDHQPGDSKPAVWWNTKYKTRWLSDGSVISGNPIYTNLLWNEIGRGSDLHQLDQWFSENPNVIQELTTAVFSTPAPRFEDFFPAEKIAKDAALRGEAIFNNTCARCHGVYEKNWSQNNTDKLSWREQMQTSRVIYPQPTRTYNVGTDAYRRESMKSLEKLNDLEISKNQNIIVKAQEGYVPPPLVGIWARWPYFHNNAIPNLCALLTRATERPKTYFAGPAIDKKKDFDSECNGYPLKNTPSNWQRTDEFYYDTRIDGMSNQGHDEGIFIKNGEELLTSQDKKDLILFLQTL